ncbi:hypothetical protein ACFYWY_11115 [Streptomyces sp. NPDC002870]|uniref:hypothetical protein n=1 Tax=Streptomyces sp. NPDC002870 TaxID=3364666 RepID=UPI00367A1390
MEIGSLVEQRDPSTAVGRIGTVRALDERGVVVEWTGGDTERLTVPESVVTLVPGSVRYRAAANLTALQSEFDNNPVEVLAQLLHELREPTTISGLRKLAEALGLGAHVPTERWSEMRQLLLAHPRVVGPKRGPLRWDHGDDIARRKSGLRLSASEALRQLAGPPRTVTAAAKKRLLPIVSARLDELSPYELLAAHALDVPVAEWPQEWAEPHPERVPEEVRAVAVRHITEVSRARRRIILPGTEPEPSGPVSREAGPPSSLPLLPLLVPLVAMPAPSRAADTAAKALSGKNAWACGHSLMECFEQAVSPSSGSGDAPISVEQLRPLLDRAPNLLRSALLRRPSEDDGLWLEFAEEMATRACKLLAYAELRKLSHGPVHEWGELVAGYPAIPIEIRAEAARAAESIKAGEPGEATAASDVPSGAVRETVRAGREQADDVFASPVAAITTEPAVEDVPDRLSEAKQPAQDLLAEIATLTKLLETERTSAEAARAQHKRDQRSASAAIADAEAETNRLRLKLADRDKQLAASEGHIQATEAKWETTQRDLAAATQRVEALTLQGQRRDNELRQARKAVRGASQAQLRQARIDTLRVLAAVLGEVADQAVHEDDESGAASALYRRVLARAAAVGVLDIGSPREEVDYDPVRHRAPGGPSARVVVERPGFVWQGGDDSDHVVLEPVVVRQAEQ